jgi:hypothetical protein
VRLVFRRLEPEERERGERGRDCIAREAPVAERADHDHLNGDEVGAERERRQGDHRADEPRDVPASE